MTSVFRLPCSCGARSLLWQDHATSCPFGKAGERRMRARQASHRLLLAALAFSGFILGIVLALLGVR